MYKLTVMGRLELRNADGGMVTSVLAQPKRLGLLAYLAVARPNGFVARAEMLSLFWPEYDDRRARNALNTAIAYLRRSLGDDTIVSRGDELGINPDRLSCDVAVFRQAVREQRWSAALDLYGGELLPALAAESVEHEHWIENERRDLLREALSAADAAVTAALQQNDVRAALAAAHRAHELAPFEEQPVRTLIGIHTRAGDVSAAIRAYDRFAEVLLRDLELEPSASLQEYAASLRQTAQRATASESVAEADVWAGASEFVSADEPVAPIQLKRVHARARAFVMAAASVATLVLFAGFGWQVLKRSASAETTGPPRTAVLPFTTRGSAGIGYLSDGLADILAARLDGVGELRTVDPNAVIGYLAKAQAAPPLEAGKAAAHHFSAGYFVVGNVTEAGDRLEINASLYDAAGRMLARANAVTTERELFAAADELARELVGGQVGGPSADLLREATVTTRSLPALKAYLEGERAYRENRLADMRVAMERALAEDSTFALAHYRLAIAAENAGGLQLIHQSIENAIRYRDRLSERHRLLLDALHAYWRGNYGDAEESYRRAVLRYPDDVETWFRLAELQFHRMPALGQPFTQARTAFERVLALDPENEGALIHLTRIAAFEGRAAQLDSLTDRALVSGEPNQRIELRVVRAFANGDAAERARAAAAAEELPFDGVNTTALRVASYTGDVRGAEALLAPLTKATSAMIRVQAHLQLAEFAAAGGRWREARHRLQELESMAPTLALTMEASFAIMPFAPMPRADLVSLRQRVSAWNMTPMGVDSLTGYHRVPASARPALRRFYLGALGLRLGDIANATNQADDLARDASAVEYGLPALLRAMIALHERRPADGLAALDSLTAGDATLAFARQDALMRYTRAQLLQAVRRDADAAGWFGSFGDLAGWDLAFLAPGEVARAAIAERRRDPAAADRHYTRALTLWQSADPELQPHVQQAKIQLERLRGR